MSQRYQLTDPAPRLYFAQALEDGSLVPIDVSGNEEDALVEMLAYYDFEGAVDDYAVTNRVNHDDACEIVLDQLRDAIKTFTPDDLLRLAASGQTWPIKAGWVREE